MRSLVNLAPLLALASLCVTWARAIVDAAQVAALAYDVAIARVDPVATEWPRVVASRVVFVVRHAWSMSV